MKHSLRTSFLVGAFLTTWLSILLSPYAQGQGCSSQTFLYTNDNTTQNTVTAFCVGTNGALTPIGVFSTGGTTPGNEIVFGSNNVAVSAVGNYLFASNYGSNDVSVFSIDTGTGSLSLVGRFPTGGSSGGFEIPVVVTPDGKFLMAGNEGSEDISVFSIAANGVLTLVSGSPFPAGGSPIGMNVSPNGAFLTVGLQAVAVFSIAQDGTLTKVTGSPFSGSGSDTGVDTKCSGNQLFAGSGVNTGLVVDVFSFSTGGMLAPILGSPFRSGVGNSSNDVLLSRYGQFLFVSNQLSDSITAFKVAANGFLTLPGSPFPVNSGANPSVMAINQSGTNLFVANAPNDQNASIGVFSVASDGSLVEVGTPVPVPGSLLEAITVFPPATCTNPVPLIGQPLVPDATPPGGSGFNLTLNGTGFVTNSIVKWNGVALPTTVVNDNQVTAMVPARDITVAGTASVTVTNPAPGGGTSNAAFFTVTTPTSSAAFASSSVGVGQSPYDVVVSDFNNDGNQDLAVVNFTSDTVSILLGNGAGAFSTKSTPAVGHAPISATAGDFNRDGNLDLAVANYCPSCGEGGSTVSILLGNGDGTFSSGSDVPVGMDPESVITADFNGDGNLDLAVTNGQSNTVSIRLGNGHGTFTSSSDIPVGNGPVGIVAGDLNGDGLLDLAVANSNDGTITILLGNGDGTFNTAGQVQVGAHPVQLAIGDFNADGKLDLAVSNFEDNTVSVLLGNGDGTFQNQVTYLTGAEPFKVAVGDLNGDNIPDLAVSNVNDNTVTIFLGTGNGTFESAGNSMTGNEPFGLGLGDFNSDGRLDLAVANARDNTVSILLQSPIASTTPSSLNFGNQTVNTTSSPLTVMLSNTGTANLDISDISIGGTNSGDFAQTNDCGSVLPFGASCNIQVTFTPTAGGVRSATLGISDNAPGSPQTVTLGGTGTGQALICTAAPGLPLVQAGSGSLTVVVSASCTDPNPNGTITSVTINWGDGSPVTSGSTGTHPYKAVGTYTITVTAIDNLGLQGNISQTVTLTLPAPPVFSGQSSQITFTAPQGLTFGCNEATGPNGQKVYSAAKIQSTFGIICGFSTTVAPPGTGDTMVTMTIQTTGGMAMLLPPKAAPRWASLGVWMPFPVIVLLGPGFLRRARYRIAAIRCVALGLIVVLVLILSSCGGGFTPPTQPQPPPGQPTTPSGMYYLTAVGIDDSGFVQTSLIVPLNVTSQ
jgi:6-phosphogluconolactonase (cycloisomerase 2 family)